MNHTRVAFGSYAMIYIGACNTMEARIEPEITLKPSNELGGYYFMSLKTGRQVHSYHWKIIPTTDYIIKQVHALADA